MPTVFLFLEFLGTTEIMVIAVVALIIFGPRKLPELGRTLGRSLGEFKRASEDFKRTWEYEVEMERTTHAASPVENTAPPALPARAESGTTETADSYVDISATRLPHMQPQMEPQAVARGSSSVSSPHAATAPDETPTPPQEEAAGSAPTSKQDWL